MPIMKALANHKIVITATFTSEPVEDSLSYWLKKIGFPYSIEFAQYNQVFQELLNPASLLATNQNGVNVILVRFEDWEGSKNKAELTLEQTLRDFGGTAFTLVYIPLLLSFAVRLMGREGGVAWVFGLVLTVVLIDTFGYLIGRFFGRTKFAPGISPKKTWEGFAASVVGALVGGQIIVLLTETNWAFGLLFGVTILISSVMGDLSESLIKRDLNVKDMGDVLPGHGGVLDRIDSLLPSAFVGYLVSMLAF